MLRPGAESVTLERGAGPTSPSALSASSPLIVLAFMGEHYRKGDGAGPFGPIGYSGRTILEDDGVTVTGRLNTPAYCYVIALTPDGKVQLYWPREPSDSPSLSAQIGTNEWGFPLTEGPVCRRSWYLRRGNSCRPSKTGRGGQPPAVLEGCRGRRRPWCLGVPGRRIQANLERDPRPFGETQELRTLAAPGCLRIPREAPRNPRDPGHRLHGQTQAVKTRTEQRGSKE